MTRQKCDCFLIVSFLILKYMKRLGKYRSKKAEAIGIEQEDVLWKKGLLGDHSPQALLDMLVYYIGLYFAIRGGEHQLRFKPSQLKLVVSINAFDLHDKSPLE